jgi:hypothetical protein
MRIASHVGSSFGVDLCCVGCALVANLRRFDCALLFDKRVFLGRAL